MLKNSWLSVAAVAAALSVSSSALAQPQADRAKAAWKLEEGKRALAKGDADKAIAALEEAHGILRLPTSGLLLAQALEKKGRLADALAVAKEVAASPKSPKEAFSITSARSEADKLAQSLDERAPKLRVTAPDGAAITVDGKDVPAEGGVRRVDPGDHVVEGRLGDKTATADVKLADGDDKTVSLDLGGKASAGAGAPAEAGGERSGEAKPSAVTKPARDDDAGQGNPAAVTAALVGFTTFAAGGGLGVGAFLWGRSRLADLDDTCGGTCTGRLAREERDAQNMQLMGFVGFGLAGAGLVTGIVGAAVAGSAGGGSESAVTPEIGPAYAGLSVRLD